MIGKEKQQEKPVTLAEAREELEKRKEELEEDEEMKYEQKITLQYLQAVHAQNPERTKKAVEELKEQDINEEIATRLVNLMPTNKDQVKLVYEKERFDLTEDKTKKILKIIDDLREA